jgi:hypothetical protein
MVPSDLNLAAEAGGGSKEKALKNDDVFGCARSVHFGDLESHHTEYHPLNYDSVVQVGPPPESQAVTKQLVAAFSFTLNTNLNTTPRQLLSSRFGIHHVHALVFKFCVQTMAEELQIDEFPS